MGTFLLRLRERQLQSNSRGEPLLPVSTKQRTALLILCRPKLRVKIDQVVSSLSLLPPLARFLLVASVNAASPPTCFLRFDPYARKGDEERRRLQFLSDVTATRIKELNQSSIAVLAY